MGPWKVEEMEGMDGRINGMEGWNGWKEQMKGYGNGDHSGMKLNATASIPSIHKWQGKQIISLKETKFESEN